MGKYSRYYIWAEFCRYDRWDWSQYRTSSNWDIRKRHAITVICKALYISKIQAVKLDVTVINNYCW